MEGTVVPQNPGQQCPIAFGAEDATQPPPTYGSCAAEAAYGLRNFVGALRAALFAQNTPQWCPGSPWTPWCGPERGSPTLAERSKRLPEFRAKNRLPSDRAFVHSIFNRDIRARRMKKWWMRSRRHPGARRLGSDRHYVDMLCKLPVVEPDQDKSATLIMRGQWEASRASRTSSSSSRCCPSG